MGALAHLCVSLPDSGLQAQCLQIQCVNPGTQDST